MTMIRNDAIAFVAAALLVVSVLPRALPAQTQTDAPGPRILLAVDRSGSLAPRETQRLLGLLAAELVPAVVDGGIREVGYLAWASPEDLLSGPTIDVGLLVPKGPAPFSRSLAPELALLQSASRVRAHEAEQRRLSAREAQMTETAERLSGVALALLEFDPALQAQMTCLWPALDRALSEERTLTVVVTDAVSYNCGEFGTARDPAEGATVVVVLVANTKDGDGAIDNRRKRLAEIARRFPMVTTYESQTVRSGWLSRLLPAQAKAPADAHETEGDAPLPKTYPAVARTDE